MEISIPDEDGGDPLNVINIVPDGDVVLDVTFEISKETLKAARKANAPKLRAKPEQPVPPPPTLRSNIRLLYRTHLSILKQQSKYFTSLLGDPRFTEAKSVEAAFQKLSVQKIKPCQADIKNLPQVKIDIDNEETQLAGQEVVFGDLLRMLHGQVIMTDPVTMPYLSTLAVLADRFGCAEPASKSLHGQIKFKTFKWPATQVRLSREEDGETLSKAGEELLRQKIYVSWLLDLPMRFQKATGELVMYGSRQWREFEDEDEADVNNTAWWYLPDDLESELKHRRTCILTTLASIPQYFVSLYTTSRTRQCKLGYDSSSSCDSYQLGETIKFLVKRNLLSLAYFSPSPSQSPQSPDFSTVDLSQILATLKQFPSYQIDMNHTNCGPRTPLKPILDFLQAMLSSKTVSISRTDWVKRREDISWIDSHSLIAAFSPSPPPYQQKNHPLLVNHKFKPIPSPLSTIPAHLSHSLNQPGISEDQHSRRVFTFTRSIAGDQRLRFEGSLGADRFVRGLFTADEWNWTPDD